MAKEKKPRSWLGEFTGISPLMEGFSGPWKSFSVLLKLTPFRSLAPVRAGAGRVAGANPEERFANEAKRAGLEDEQLDQLEERLAHRAVFLSVLAILAWGYSLSFLFGEFRNAITIIGIAQNLYILLFPAALNAMAIRDLLKMYQVRHRALVTFPEWVARLLASVKSGTGGDSGKNLHPPSITSLFIFFLSATALCALWPHILYAQTVSAGAAGPIDLGQSSTSLSGAYGTLTKLGSSDLSGQWLARLFPSLSGGSSTDQLSSLLTSFNTILLDAGTGLAFWQGSLGIIYAAQNGSLEGSNIHAVISPVRTLLGPGLCSPSLAATASCSSSRFRC